MFARWLHKLQSPSPLQRPSSSEHDNNQRVFFVACVQCVRVCFAFIYAL